MLRPEDQRAIEDLFERLGNVARNSAPRDADAEELIRQRLSAHPEAAYYMAQTIVVQEAALREQQERIAALEERAENAGGGFLGSIFGGGDRPQRQERQEPARRAGPWDRPAQGGFLAGAAQTALGVTGGVLLGSAIAGMFSTPVEAAEMEPAAPEDAGPEEGLDGGGDDWGGGFDIGGDF
ncbi:DUF2076 domain-containing protein [Devosia chinhatensis]|uniref:ABC transporter substrate-binding protein n=1 Tax=Devosia chinhatensis TaxID=429727 RepID=A0A0F5FLE6_9HYPH|nr:DUF2076 domain-containing protein [Devosia chinhatensis]KKB09671.1 hypothetical protein VE26_07320 [Devosia chinhatensis]